MSSGPSAIFNDFINDNAIVSSTEPSSSPQSGDTDDSSSSSSSILSRIEDRLYRMRQRSRNHRLQSLRNQILQRLGMDRPPTVTISPEVRNRVIESFPALFNHPANHTDRRCYSASCNVPHKVNETLWQNSSSRSLRLFVPVPRDRSSDAALQSATLYVFLKPNALRQVRCDCDGEEGEGEHRPCGTIHGFLVQVHQYNRPLSIRRRGRVVNRRRLLDAKFVAATGNQWLSFNIRNVASDWRRHRRNFGVEVTMRDDNDTEIDAKTMFVLPDCSVGREVGCRESSSDDEDDNRHSLPIFVSSYRDNFPYVDLVAIRAARASSPRSRRSLRHTQQVRHHPNTSSRQSPRNQSTTALDVTRRPPCLGEKVVINITDEAIEEPRSFVSHTCPSTCLDCSSHGQCTPRPCAAPKTAPVVGRYRLEDGTSQPRILPFTRIVSCGC
ncbi:hypothetical protein ACOMHN_020707 [Nucella lapillus]